MVSAKTRTLEKFTSKLYDWAAVVEAKVYHALKWLFGRWLALVLDACLIGCALTVVVLLVSSCQTAKLQEELDELRRLQQQNEDLLDEPFKLEHDFYARL